MDLVVMEWMFTEKYNVDGSLLKRKSRLVAKGSDFDFEETFPPFSLYEPLRIFLALSAHCNWPIYHLDVDSLHLPRDLEEAVCGLMPVGFLPDRLLKVLKAFYGMKQAPRGWYGALASFLDQNGFERSGDEPTLYMKKGADDGLLLVCVFVEDVIYMGSSFSLIAEFKESMMSLFGMTDLRMLHSFLGLEIKQCDDGVFVSQRKYAQDLLERFNMANCESAITPMGVGEMLDGTEKAGKRGYESLVRGLVHLTHTRPDIAFAVGVVSRFMDDPTVQQLGAAKRILRYIAGTRDFGIWYSNVDEAKLIGFTDSDWAGYDDRRSISGSVFSFGSGAVAWSSKKQGVARLSTSEAEYMAVTASACQAMWLRRLLADLDQKQEEATEIFCDNVVITKYPFVHGRTEHIDNQFHLIRNLVSDGFVSLKFCNSDEQVAEIFTKALPYEKHIKFRTRLGVCKYESRGSVE